jgi:DNA-binding NarL/FixJ family response regulator
MSIKILLADDSEIVRRGIRQLLSAETEIEIVGEAADFAQTIQTVSDVKPEVIVLDLHMPGETNFSPQAVKSRLTHGLRLLTISLSNDEEAKALSKGFGAVVLLDKIDLASTLIPAIAQLGRKPRSVVAAYNELRSASIASKKPESELVRGTLGEVGQRGMSVEADPV